MTQGLAALVRRSIRPLVAYVAPEARAAVKLDANECPFALPAEARARVGAAVAALDLNRYPDARADGLRRAIAQTTGGTPEDIVVGVGSDEVIAMLMTALSEPRGGRANGAVLYPVPTFVMYGVTAATHGLEPVEVPLGRSFQLDVGAMVEAIHESRPNLVFLATPNNPTGNTFDDGSLREVIAADPDALFVLDEAYAPYAGRSLAAWCDELSNVALLGTVSKVGMAGIRVGWCRLPPVLAGEVQKVRQPYNLGSVSQTIAELALGELSPILAAQTERVIAERERLGRALSIRPDFEVFPSAANFLFVRYAGDPDALLPDLDRRDIRIKSFHGAGGRLAHHLRITVGTPAENEALLAALP